MDPQTLAQQIVPVLAPVLPYLVKAGEQAAGEVGKIAAGVAGEKIKALWGRIWSKMDGKPAAQEAVQELVKNPDDADAQGAFRLQLRKLLADDADLLADVARLWAEVNAASGVGNTNIAAGNRLVAIGGHVSGSVIVTGDQNQIKPS